MTLIVANMLGTFQLGVKPGASEDPVQVLALSTCLASMVVYWFLMLHVWFTFCKGQDVESEEWMSIVSEEMEEEEEEEAAVDTVFATNCEETPSTTHADDDAQRSLPTPTRRNNGRWYGTEGRAPFIPSQTSRTCNAVVNMQRLVSPQNTSPNQNAHHPEHH